MQKLSIITVNLNNAAGLQKTIDSIIIQSFVDFEFIIIDGGSTDGSKEIIERYADKLTYWVSEPDKGIYNGMNKGINVSKGEYCFFLNSGDFLFEKEALFNFMQNTESKDIIYGNVVSEKGEIKYSDTLTKETFFFGTICHQAAFIKKSLFEKHGSYDEKLTVIADWAFFVKAILVDGCSYSYKNKVVTEIEWEGVSTNPIYTEKSEAQRKEILTNYFPEFYNIYDEIRILRKELSKYKNSRLIKFVDSIRYSKLYLTFLPGRS